MPVMNDKGKQTIRSVVEKTDELYHNKFSYDQKSAWVETLDARIRVEILNIAALERPYPSDIHLSVPLPYEHIYQLYLLAMIHQSEQDYTEYNNAMALFNEAWEAFTKEHISSVRPRTSPQIRHLWR
jgi:hypothetical protein